MYIEISSDLHSQLGEVVLLRRRELGLTQAFIAQSVGLTPQHVSLIESGQSGVSVPTWRALGQVLGLDGPTIAAFELRIRETRLRG